MLRSDFERSFPADSAIAVALDRTIGRLKEVR